MGELAQSERVNTNERIGSKYAIQRKVYDLAETRPDTRIKNFEKKNGIDSQSQFRIHPYARISTYFGKPKLSPSGHISVYRNMIFRRFSQLWLL